MEYKAVLGGIAVFIAIISYIPYIKDVWQEKTRPHVFSWLVWSLMMVVAFVAQVVDGGGAGTWAIGFTAFACLLIFVFSFRRGEKNITTSDKASMVGVFISLLLWYVTNDPLISVILITCIDVFAFFPTFRKSFSKPQEETLITYSLSVLKFIISIIALEQYTVVTWLYPAVTAAINGAFVCMVFIRKKQLSI